MILGVLEPKQQADVIDFVILQAKWYIVRKKMKSENVGFKEFQHRVYYILQIEQYIYKVKDKIGVFHEIVPNVYKEKQTTSLKKGLFINFVELIHC